MTRSQDDATAPSAEALLKRLRDTDAAMHALPGGSPERAALGEELRLLSHAVFDLGGPGSEVADPTDPIALAIAVTEIDPEQL